MALTKQKKQEVIEEVSKLLAESKLTVVAKYDGTTVKQLQTLRKQAKEGDTVVKVVKNRLVIQALKASDLYKDADKSALNYQLLYAFNSSDEVAPAKALADFAKKNPSIQFVGAYTTDGVFVGADEVKSLAALPSKNQLIAGLINTLNSPVNGIMSGLSGNLHGLLQGLEAKASEAK
jgi:large subunit ribosomal protein L10